jgi:hypothetical protein
MDLKPEEEEYQGIVYELGNRMFYVIGELLKLIPVFRIHDILVWIRIRGSMPLTNGSGFRSGSCFFRH